MFLILGLLLALGTVNASPLTEVKLQPETLTLDTQDTAAAPSEVQLQNDIELDTLDTAAAPAEVQLQPDTAPLDTLDTAAFAGVKLQNNSDALSFTEVKLQRGSCPMFWYGFNGRCYKYIATLMTWAQAELNCLSQGANLASIHSQEENNFVRNLIKNFDPSEDYTWIGLSDIHQEGEWMWSDGSKVDFTLWYGDEPNGGVRHNCGHINCMPGNKWCDFDCSERPKHSVCASRIACP